MQRTLWKGAISFGLVHIPVNLYSAETRHDLDLSMVDKRDFSPIGYKRINKETGKEVEWSNIVKAFEVEPGEYVALTDEDLRRANVKATQTIDIVAFVDAAQVPIIHYEQPYFLTPDKGGGKVYALLRETLRRSGKLGIAQVVLRSRQHLAALIPMGDMIVLNTLRWATEIRDAGEFDLPGIGLKQAGLSEKEVAMALALVEGMTEEWDARQYRDTYRDDVLALVDKKVKARQTRTLTEPEENEQPAPSSAKIIDLMALLKQSVGSRNSGAESKPTGEKPTSPGRSGVSGSAASAKPAAKTASKRAAKTTATAGRKSSTAKTSRTSATGAAAKTSPPRRARAA